MLRLGKAQTIIAYDVVLILLYGPKSVTFTVCTSCLHNKCTKVRLTATLRQPLKTVTGKPRAVYHHTP